MGTKDTQVNEIEDVTLAAFLQQRGRSITPRRKPNGRVVFEARGDITADIQALYSNQQVGILDFIRILKSLRSSIFALKTPQA
ncbi:MAG: hypothetical protein ACLP9S_18585 [Syntrophales bacterium]